MNAMPFKDMTQCTRRKTPIDNATFYLDSYLEVSVLRVKVWRRMISIEHSYHNSKESTDFWHRLI